MKKLILSMLAMSLFWAFAMAQAPKGTVFLGSSTAIVGGIYGEQNLTTATNSGGISFSKVKYKYDGASISGEKATVLNLSPRVGYAFADGFIAGLKMDFLSLTVKDQGDKETVTGIGAGPFLRYFIPTKGKAKPFLEAQAALGRITDKYEDEKYKVNTTEFGGGLGISFFFNDHVTFDVMGGYISSSMKDADSSDEEEKIINSGFGLGLGLTVFLSPTSK
jgi:outer membrane protein